MASFWNIRAAGTCKSDIKGFGSDALKPYNNCKHRTFIRLCDRRLRILITQNKYSIIINIVSTVMFKGAGIVKSRKGADMVESHFST